MKLLNIDTSTKNFSLAVSDDEKILKYRNIQLNRVLSSSIIPGIKDILKRSGVRLKQLDGFAVGLGPGSFTSLRVGLSTVKALAFATQKPIVGIPSLDIMAMNVVNADSPQICTLCDAKRDLVFSCLFENKKGLLKRKSKYRLVDIHEALAPLKGETLFVGDGVPLYKEEIVKKLKSKASFADKKNYFPQAKNLLPLALERFRQKRHDDINKIIPLYLYPEDCQVRRKHGSNKKK